MGVCVFVSRGKDTGRRGDTSVTSCSGPYHGLNSVGRRYQEQSKMPSQGGSVLLYTRNPSPSPMVPGKLKLIILNFQYFESPRQKRRNTYCLARKRKVESLSGDGGT